jgi:type II secretory ATPase GspE/PulE/Tfp pilus assembly ATPase PilB-like protein
LDLAAGLRAVLRQDPEVIAVGEIRDPATAITALQASLTGQLVLTTFHAGSASAAVSRLLDMALEPYILRSGILAVICQRLVRRLCTCSVPCEAVEPRLGLPVTKVRLARSCAECNGTGYRGRLLLAEMLNIASAEVATAILDRWDTNRLEQAAVRDGMNPLWRRACQAVEDGLTSPDEIRRVLGFSDAIPASLG